jgi:predicted enzyme related to lactoylglutathione lyase
MKDAWEDIQRQTFEVGYAAEESGDYATAIKFYKQVQPRTDRERFRIGVCHKLDANYSEALTWFRKLNANRDDVQFEIGSTYALWEKHDKAVEAYCKVIASFGGSELEEEALSLLEDYETQGSFNGLYQKIASAYRQKAFASFRNDFDRAVSFYKKSMDYVARDYDNSAARASDALVRTASTDLTSALTILDEQNQAALEYYERKLQNAHSDFRYAKRNYQDALDDGAREFEHSLRRARQQKRTYERNYNRYLQQNLSEEADRARRQMEHYENRIRYLLMNRDTIIYDSADYERRRMNDAEDTYHRILHSQQRIISDYVAPYRRAVNDARERLDQINAFHRAAYGF